MKIDKKLEPYRRKEGKKLDIDEVRERVLLAACLTYVTQQVSSLIFVVPQVGARVISRNNLKAHSQCAVSIYLREKLGHRASAFICVVTYISWSTAHLQITRRDNTIYRMHLLQRYTHKDLHT